MKRSISILILSAILLTGCNGGKDSSSSGDAEPAETTVSSETTDPAETTVSSETTDPAETGSDAGKDPEAADKNTVTTETTKATDDNKASTSTSTSTSYTASASNTEKTSAAEEAVTSAAKPADTPDNDTPLIPPKNDPHADEVTSSTSAVQETTELREATMPHNDEPIELPIIPIG